MSHAPGNRGKRPRHPPQNPRLPQPSVPRSAWCDFLERACHWSEADLERANVPSNRCSGLTGAQPGEKNWKQRWPKLWVFGKAVGARHCTELYGATLPWQRKNICIVPVSNFHLLTFVCISLQDFYGFLRPIYSSITFQGTCHKSQEGAATCLPHLFTLPACSDLER